MAYSKITNKLFYTNEEGKESILKIVNDNKVVLVMHYLILLTNRVGEVTVSLDYLIKKCGYKADKDSRKSFKNILDKLKELGYINFDNINKSNDIIIIDTTALNVDTEFFIAEDDEMETIKSVAEDMREYVNLLKVYYYLKARIHKSKKDSVVDAKSQSTFNPYGDIANRTMISEMNIKKYIDKLQDIGLIKYANSGYKYRADNINLKTECANVYVLAKISKDEETLKHDLKEGLKLQELYYEDKGYIITKKGYKNNDKKINGKYGSLIKKEKNNTLTEQEEKELNKIRLAKELENNTLDELIS